MTPERHARAKAIFLAALALAGDERERYVDEACAGDDALREEVASLLDIEGLRLETVAGDAPGSAEGSVLGGRYEVGRVLGSGGMGRVYAAVDLRFGRTVAVKELVLATPELLAGFEREARLLNDLRHRALPVVTDYFAEGDRFFLVMDFVSGRDFGEVMRGRREAGEGPLAVSDVLRWADQILDALEYLGSLAPPVVHRDIKPQNLKLTDAGEAVLLDFGLAKGSVSGATSGPLRSVAAFTPRFAPLEQIRGGGTDARSDLYSLGATLYNLLTGVAPPDAVSRAEAVVAGLADPLRRADDVNPRVPAGVAAVLADALALHRDRRPASAAALRAALRAAAPDAAHARRRAQTGGEPEIAPSTSAMRDGAPNNLPEPLTSFIGREREIEEVVGLCRTSRLVTLLGMGGIGKTRLALRTAADLIPHFRGGVWLADLSALSEPSLLAMTIAGAVGIPADAGAPADEALRAWFREREALVVLDNCEQLADACARLAEHLLRGCPRLSLLATSRERLGVAGEAVYNVGPLPLPSDDKAPSDAVRLFVSRARLARPSFEASGASAEAVAEICRRLEGIPLAIELAAARVGVLSVAEILVRLGDRFSLLSSRDRTALSRQRTLRAAIDWSYELLSEEERSLLRRLAVFAGGWTLEAAEAVALSGDVDGIAALVDKSLVLCEERGTGVRYRMLETIREYAAERLREAGEDEAAGEAHAAWALALARRAASEFSGAEQRKWLASLDAEHDNLRAALAWSLAPRPARGEALALATALVRYWHMRGLAREGRAWLERAIEASPEAPAPERAEALMRAGTLADVTGDYATALDCYEQSLALLRSGDAGAMLASCLVNLSLTRLHRGDYDGAAEHCREALEIYRRLGDERQIGIALNNLGAIELERGDVASSARCHGEALAIRRALGDDFGAANSLSNLATLSLVGGDAAQAVALAEESLTLRRGLGEKRGLANSLTILANAETALGRFAPAREALAEVLALSEGADDLNSTIVALESFAKLASAEGAWARALRLGGAAAAARQRTGAALEASERSALEAALAAATRELGEEAAARETAAGAAMSVHDAADLARSWAT